MNQLNYLINRKSTEKQDKLIKKYLLKEIKSLQLRRIKKVRTKFLKIELLKKN